MVQINVRGSHTTRLPPERVTAHLEVGFDGPEAAEVVASATRTAGALTAALEPFHDPERGPVVSWSTDRLQTWSGRPWNDRGEQLPLVHHATISVRVELSDLEQVGSWLEEVAATEGVTVQRLGWSLTEEARRREEGRARAEALRDARRRAQDYAAALELGEVRVVSVSDPGTARAAHAELALMRGGGVEDDALRLHPEDVEVVAEVEASFEA